MKRRKILSGWHRLWVLCSGIYFLAIVVLAYNAVPRKESVYAKWAEDVLEIIADDSNRGQAKKFTADDFRTTKNLRRKTNEEIVAEFTAAARRIDLSKPGKAEMADFKERILDADFRHTDALKKLRGERVSVLLWFGAAWLLPVGVVLAVGHAIAWVREGFRKEEPKAPEPTPTSVTSPAAQEPRQP